MTSTEAARLLNLSPDAPPAEIEKQFLAAKAALEEKAAKALSPGLKARYETALAEITTAYETLMVAADAAAIPALQSTEPAPPPRLVVTPPASGAAQQFGWHVIGMLKGGLAALLGFFLFMFWEGLADHSQLQGLGNGPGGSFNLIVGLLGFVLLPGLFTWLGSVRKAQQRPGLRKPGLISLLVFGAIYAGGVMNYQSHRSATPDPSDVSTAKPAAAPAPAAAPTPEELVARGLRFRSGGNGGAPDRRKAMQLFQQAADQGSPTGMFWLGSAYEEGTGGRPELEQALDWYQKAAVLGEPQAVVATKRVQDILAEQSRRVALNAAIELSNRATDLWNAKGPARDPAGAVKLWQEAAKQDVSSAMWGLGLAYQSGDGVAADPSAARRWFKQAAKLGNDGAKQKLAELDAADPAHAPGKGVSASHDTPEMPGVPDWATRTLRAPPGYEMLQPSDVIVGFSWKRQYDRNGSMHDIPGEMDFSSMRMAPGATHKEASRNRDIWWGGASVPDKVVWKGSDLTGGRIGLGWVAWVSLSEWWPEDNRSYPSQGCAFVYGAVSLEEAIEAAFRMALVEYRKHSPAPIQTVNIEAGVSAVPDYDLYRRVVTSRGSMGAHALPFNFYFGTPSQLSEARRKGWNETIPEDPVAFVKFACAWRKPTVEESRFILERQKDNPWWDGRSYFFFNLPKAGMAPPVFEVVR